MATKNQSFGVLNQVGREAHRDLFQNFKAAVVDAIHRVYVAVIRVAFVSEEIQFGAGSGLLHQLSMVQGEVTDIFIPGYNLGEKNS